ncbi:hypothetical protein ACFL20_07310, partial [Spirochaetota bacterium]
GASYKAYIETVPGSGGMMGTRPTGRPHGIKVDTSGNIYVIDIFYAAIFIYDSSLEFQQTMGEYGSDTGKFRSPTDLAIMNDGSILVTNTRNRRIEKLNGI